MTELPGMADAAGWRRLHPLSPVLRGGIVFIVVVGIIVANFRDRLLNIFVADRLDLEEGGEASRGGDVVALFEFLAERGLVLIVIGSLLGLIVLAVLLAWISWRFATYRVTDAAVEVRRGAVFRSHRRAPLERIQSVNLQRSLFARILGLTKIDVVTAGQGGKVELAYLGYREAKIVREQILREVDARQERSGSAPDAPTLTRLGETISARAEDFADADIDADAIAAHTLVTVPVPRLIASIALSWDAVILVLILLAIILGSALIEAAMILAIVPVLLVMAGVLFGRFNKGFRFTLSRGSDAVRIGSGLTATSTETIPFGRIHAIEARQPLLWRKLGWWSVRVTTAGHSAAQAGQNSLQNVVLPVGFVGDVVQIITSLLPELADSERAAEQLHEDLRAPAPEALRAGPRAGWVLWWGKRRASLRIADPGERAATLRITRGVLTRSLSVMPLVRAQSVQLRRPGLHRALDLASVQAHTVLGPVRVEMRGIALGAAREAFETLAREVIRVQNAESRHTRKAGS